MIGNWDITAMKNANLSTTEFQIIFPSVCWTIANKKDNTTVNSYQWLIIKHQFQDSINFHYIRIFFLVLHI